MEDTTNVSIVEKNERTEVLDSKGNTLESNTSELSSIFDKIEAGKADGKSSTEVVREHRAAQPVEKDESEVEVPDKKEVKDALTPPEKQAEKAPDKVEENTREKLKSLTDENKVKAPDPDEVPESEMKVLPSDKPKTAKRIQALLKKIDAIESESTKTKTEATEKAAKLAELEAKLSTVKTADPATEAKVKTQLDELAMYRRRYELDKDPEVKTKFDSRLEGAETTIIETLKRRNAGDALLKLINDEGGWQKFSNSGRVVNISDGEGGTKPVTTAELAESILQALPLGERKSVEAAMVEQVQTTRDKERYFKEQQAAAADYFKKREEDGEKARSTHQKMVEENGKFLTEWHKKTLAADWIKDKEVAASASAAEKAAAEEYNKYNAQMRSILDKGLKTNDLAGMVEVVGDSVRYYDERRTSANLRKELERVKGELDRFKKGGSSVPRSGSIAAGSSSGPVKAKQADSLEEAFSRIERGESLDGESE